MLHETLKQATQPDHDRLEQLMFVNQIMTGTLSLAQYKQILATNCLVHNAFESFIFNGLSPHVAQQVNINQRRKLPALMADLDELHMEAPADENVTNITLNKTDAELLGAMYVLEGATLGGSVIVKRLKTNPQLSNLGLNFNYYQVYGSELIPNWKAFCQVLDLQPENTYTDAVNGAKKMFGYIASVQEAAYNFQP